MTYSRDPDFYTGDGDCVVRVGDTLFNISRDQFSRNSTAFRNLFVSSSHKWSEEFPLILRGDTPEDFRLLCQLFQASPMDLQLHHARYRESSALLQLFSLREILVKYGCQTYVAWATEAISQHPLWAGFEGPHFIRQTSFIWSWSTLTVCKRWRTRMTTQWFYNAMPPCMFLCVIVGCLA
ncbi:hypothetical protein C8R44DRAFT_308513 [Mycena epipterygia]|nr:hypothetical protein C8R44DRAFT_308513 [Mycena epipterygia]